MCLAKALLALTLAIGIGWIGFEIGGVEVAAPAFLIMLALPYAYGEYQRGDHLHNKGTSGGYDVFDSNDGWDL